MSDTFVRASNLEGIEKLGTLVRDNTVQVPTGTEGETSVGFFSVMQNPGSVLTSAELASAVKDAPHGYYMDVDTDRLKVGPSYIELGAWIGDQGLALSLMGLGKILGLWEVITPADLGVTGEKASEMMGLGFVLIAPVDDSPLFE